MAEPARARSMTHAEFLAFEAQSDERHAFHDGELFSMAGGTRMHGMVATQLATVLNQQLRAAGRPCFACGSDVRVSPSEGDSTYPDVTVTCPPVVAPPWDPEAIANPVAIVEVLSPPTADWDRGGKFTLYQRFATLRHYLLAHADAWHVQHRARQADGSWRLTEHGADDVLHLEALGVELAVAEIYAPMLALGGPARDTRPVERPPRVRG